MTDPLSAPDWRQSWTSANEEARSWDEAAAFDARRSSGRSGSDLPIEWGEEIRPQLNGMWLIKKLLPQQGLALIYGHPGSGKSFLAVDFAMHVALGWEWGGRITRKGLVVYVGAEGQQGLRNRIVAFRMHHAIEGPVPLALVPCPIDLQAPEADRARLALAVRQAAGRYGEAPALIVVDTISKTFGAGKENTDDMATYVANCGWLASEFGCCVMPVHHRPKDAESTEPRGHGSLKGGVDTVILVEAGKPKKARVTKQKDAEDGDSFLFTLKPVDLGADEDGEMVTSCVIEMVHGDYVDVSNPKATAITRLPDGPKLALKQLDEALIAHGFAPPADIPDGEINRVLVGKVIETGTWREKAILAAGTDRDMDRDTGKKAFNRALTRLQSLGIVRVWGPYAWREW